MTHSRGIGCGAQLKLKILERSCVIECFGFACRKQNLSYLYHSLSGFPFLPFLRDLGNWVPPLFSLVDISPVPPLPPPPPLLSWVFGMGERKEAERRVVRVLVVDDSIVDRKIVEKLLLKSGDAKFDVVAVDSGKKAMEILGLLAKEENSSNSKSGTGDGDNYNHGVDDGHNKIDIILTDYCMPEISGYDLLKAVKGSDCLKSIPIVIMSSENDPLRITRCEASGAEEFIPKPLKTADIQRLRSYARLPEEKEVEISAEAASPKSAPTGGGGTKRKLSIEDIMADGNGSSERQSRPRLARVTVV